MVLSSEGWVLGSYGIHHTTWQHCPLLPSQALSFQTPLQDDTIGHQPALTGGRKSSEEGSVIYVTDYKQIAYITHSDC